MLTRKLIEARTAGRLRRPGWWITSAQGDEDRLVITWTDGVNRVLERYPTDTAFLSIMRPNEPSERDTPMRSQRRRAYTAENPEA